MANFKKTMMAAAGAAGGGALDVDDVFSTYLWTGDATAASSRSISNGIDLAGEGGLAWIKRRGATQESTLYDSERSLVKHLSTDNTNPSQSDSFDTSGDKMKTFNSDGFSVGYLLNNFYHGGYVSWTFRKAPKFFDIVTWTGDGTGARVIPHSLGTAPGMYIAKTTAINDNWFTYHRSLGGVNNYVSLDRDQAKQNNTNIWSAVEPTATHFSVGAGINISGRTYVTYLFAHNDGDGEFGPDGDADIIKCGSFPWGSTSGTEVNLGFEPQWILFKAADQSGKDWFIFDAMRGIVTGGFSGDGDAALFPNTSGAENVNTWGVDLTPTGFIAYGNNIASSGNIIYMAIRRGPMAVPESATDVFAIDTRGGTSPSPPELTSGFVTDFLIYPNNTETTNDKRVIDRFRGDRWLYADKTNAEVTVIGKWDYMDGHGEYSNIDSNDIGFMWKRAPGFFDMVAMTGTSSSSSHTVNHNLTVPPEMVWIKRRDGTSSWNVYHNDGSTERTAYLESTLQGFSNSRLDSSGATSIVVSGGVLDAGATYIMYLFATLPGISKVGSYTGNGSSQTINCGFSSGARFILIKRTDSTGNWYVWNTTRGIVSGNDPYLLLNSTAAEVTSNDSVDPANSGFIVNQISATNVNVSSANYIFYAIA